MTTRQRLSSWTLCACALAALCGPSPVLAETVRLDDSLSHTVPANAQMQWRRQSRSSDSSGMEAALRVNIHIDTRDWVGRSGRIYMVLARDQNSTIEAVWTSNGPLNAGRLLSGERTLVYSGTVRGPAIKDQLQLRLRSGPDWQSENRRLNFYFEFDTSGPSGPAVP